MKINTMLIILAMILALGGPAGAQEQGPGSMGGRYGGPRSDEKREEIRKKVEAVWVWKVTEALALDEATAAKLLPSVSSLRMKHRELRRQKMHSLQELRVTLQSREPDAKKLRASLNRIEKNRDQRHRLRKEEFRAAKKLLTLEQQARYVLFQREFRREMRGMISRARGRGRGMKGMGSGAGPGLQGRPTEER